MTGVQTCALPICRRPKWKSCEIGNDNDGLELEEKSTGVLRRCRVRKQTRRETISHDVDMDSEVAINQKKRKGRAKKSLEVDSNTDDLEGCVENREDEDLTMEDLMSIAKEVIQSHFSSLLVDNFETGLVFRKIMHSVLLTLVKMLASNVYGRQPWSNVRNLLSCFT